MDPVPPSRWRLVHTEASLGWGGQEHRVLAELTGFRQRGSSCWLVAPPTARLVERARATEVPVRLARFDRWLYPWTIPRLALWLRSVNAQVVNTHSSRDGWAAGCAARLARVPLVLRTRHIDVDYPHHWVSRHAYRSLADHVLTTSPAITAHLQQALRLPPERASTIPTGIDLECFCPAGPAAPLLPPGPSPAPPLIGMVSVLRSWKGHDTFLAAAHQLVQSGLKARFVIVGEGPVRSRLEARVLELSLGPWVTLVGHREDIPAVLRALAILVIASTRHEGIPQIGLQALATKTPVVGSNVGGIPAVIQPGLTGRIFPAGDAAALADALRDTLADPTATRAMCDRGRAHVEARHSLRHMLDELESVYRRYLGLSSI
ncbi:MAG: glycosyltransferase family 4 protein [Verrucomicrobia bacterium]|nr:glycosyltransferase family 4 protein [Verrucomicrobiota bacterium]